jgi:hypothetical protein
MLTTKDTKSTKEEKKGRGAIDFSRPQTEATKNGRKERKKTQKRKSLRDLRGKKFSELFVNFRR